MQISSWKSEHCAAQFFARSNKILNKKTSLQRRIFCSIFLNLNFVNSATTGNDYYAKYSFFSFLQRKNKSNASLATKMETKFLCAVWNVCNIQRLAVCMHNVALLEVLLLHSALVFFLLISFVHWKCFKRNLHRVEWCVFSLLFFFFS